MISTYTSLSPLITDKSGCALGIVVAISLALFASTARACARSDLTKFHLSGITSERESNGTLGKFLGVDSRGRIGGARLLKGRGRNRSRDGSARSDRHLVRDFHIGSILGHQGVFREVPKIPVDHGRHLEVDLAGGVAGDGNKNLGNLLVQIVYVSRTRHPNGTRSGRDVRDANPLTVARHNLSGHKLRFQRTGQILTPIPADAEQEATETPPPPIDTDGIGTGGLKFQYVALLLQLTDFGLMLIVGSSSTELAVVTVELRDAEIDTCVLTHISLAARNILVIVTLEAEQAVLALLVQRE